MNLKHKLAALVASGALCEVEAVALSVAAIRRRAQVMRRRLLAGRGGGGGGWPAAVRGKVAK